MLVRMVQQIRFGLMARRWIRLRPDGDDAVLPLRLDANGFLDPGAAEADGLIRPREAAAHRGFVLLGQPGSGKTATFDALIDQLGQETISLPAKPDVVHVGGSELVDRDAVDDLLGVPLNALPAADDSQDAVDELVVIIDGLDESPYLRHLPAWLRRKLAGRDIRKLRIWVACRTAEYPEEFTKVLADALGSCVVGDLAPLTRQDAADLVASTGTDAETFLAAVTGTSAGVLATTPLTLLLLLSVYLHDPDAMRSGPRRLFESGVTALADEPTPGRVTGPLTSTAQQRVAIAARIAAYLLLSGRRTITLQTGWLGAAGDHAVPIGSLVGAHETAGAGEFPVTKAMVQETLATALFTYTAQNTVAFAHSSFAAFLAARYLAERIMGAGRMPAVKQLRGLFLVSAPDEDTAAIPEHLRETAAWLLAHAPVEAEWLAEADPEGLVSHSGLITDPRSRSTLVGGLLQRADRIELTDRSWQQTPWRLAHPGLAGQLAAALAAGEEDPTSGWAGVAQVRLAVRLAQDSGLPELADPLLRVVESPAWPIGIRQLAARAAMTADLHVAVPRLQAVLAGLQPEPDHSSGADEAVVEESGADSPSELVGTLLRLLWPQHLSFVAALPHIRPVSTRWFLGMYLFQVREFPRHVADEDISELITLAGNTLRAHGITLDRPDSDATETETNSATAGAALSVERVRILRDFVAPIIDRILASPHPSEHLPRIARIVLWFLYSAERLPLPAAVDLLDHDGVEPDMAMRLRRALAEQLLSAGLDTGEGHLDYLVALVISRWGSVPGCGADREVPPGTHRAHRNWLLGSEDANWAAQRSEHHRAAGATALADTFTRLAAALTPCGSATPDDATEPGWDAAGDFAAQQRADLDHATNGDPTAFRRLVANLTMSPKTGNPEPVTSWDVTRYPGAALWPEEQLRAGMRTAARHYLETEHDDRATWLGTTKPNGWRSRAGYIALATLYGVDQDLSAEHDHADGLASLPDGRWAAWVGAIVEHANDFGDTDELDRALLDRAAQHAPKELAQAVEQYAWTRLTDTSTPLRLPDLPAQLTPLLAQLAAELDDALRAPQPSGTTGDAPGAAEPEVDTQGPIVLSGDTATLATSVAGWATLLRQPLRDQNPAATQLALSAVSHHGEPPSADGGPASELEQTMAVAAAHALVAADAELHWPAVHDAITESDEFARALAVDLAADSYTTNSMLDALNEEGLGQLFRWLASVFPPDTDLFQPGVSFVTPKFHAHDLRRDTITALTRHGTPDAVHQLHQLADDFPDRLDLGAALVDARRSAQAKAVAHPAPEQVAELLHDSSRRVVHTAAQLADVITETLDHIAEDLHTHGHLLWDCERLARPEDAPPHTRRQLAWRPKTEGSLAAYLAHELRLRLGHRRIIVNREVVIRPTDAGDSGERPDIIVEATSPDDHSSDARIISVPVEIKGSWHREVLTAQETQLTARYLPAVNTNAGVYVVGWYPLEQWDAPDDDRKNEAQRQTSSDALQQTLEQQAARIRTNGRSTRPYVFAIPRPTAHTDLT